LNIDIAPTILRYAGVAVPQMMQGLDLNATKAAGRSYFYYEHHYGKAPALPQVEGIVAKDHKYIYYPEFNYEEFFDLRSDPHELRNIAGVKDQLKLLTVFRERYKQQREITK
jgi:arylsulfatase A-like enzyme